MDQKAMLGHKVRRFRTRQKLTQAQLAKDLDISASYLNLIEHNQRPVTVPLLIKLAQIFEVDLQSFAEDDETRLFAELSEAFADPLFAGATIKRTDIREIAQNQPDLAQAILALYQTYHATRTDLETLAEKVADQEQLQALETQIFPVGEVRDFLQTQQNHFPELEEAAEAFIERAGIDPAAVFDGMASYLKREHSISVKIMPLEVTGPVTRRFDRHSRRIMLSEVLDMSGRTFQLAAQLGLLEARDAIDDVLEKQKFSGPEALGIARMALVNYFAGAMMMPYDAFLGAARKLRYDLDLLGHRFAASFEQVCHRLTTLQRSGAKGVPFFMIRLDQAGNVSKRFSAARLQFARFGGACPRWTVYDAFRDPSRLHIQLGEMPDGERYFSVARAFSKPSTGFRTPEQHFAISLGCAVKDADALVYADGIDLEGNGSATPIGVNCRLCPRLDCGQRAFPPLNHRLDLSEHIRERSPYAFMPIGVSD